MDTLTERLLARANEIYGREHLSYPDRKPQAIDDDQVKAVVEAFAEEIEQLRDEMERYYERKRYDGYD